MDNGVADIVHRLRPLGLIPVIALGLLSTLASGGGGGDGSIPSSPGTIELLEISFDATEGTIVNILVRRSGGNAGVVSVDYATADDTALGGSDYLVSSGTLTWTDGLSGNQTVSIPITDDNSFEPSESFTVTLRNVSGAMLGTNSSATVNIIDTGSTRLTDLSISAGKFDQIFQPGLTDYTAAVGLLRSTTTVTAEVEDPNAMIRVNGAEVVSGDASDKVTLFEGSNTITVSVTTADDLTTGVYTIEVIRAPDHDFSQEAYFKADDPEGRNPRIQFPSVVGHPDLFGSAVAYERDTLVVGSWGEDIPGRDFDWGAVYLFTRDQSGVWGREAKLTAPDTFGEYSYESDDEPHFGISVALSADTLFAATIPSEIAVNFHYPIGGGAVHTYRRDLSGIWTAQETILPDRPFNENAIGQFGISISAHRDTLVVGDPRGRNRNTDTFDDGDVFDTQDREGDAFIYHRAADDSWDQVLRFVGPAPEAGDHIGTAVGLDMDTIAIGAPGEDSAPSGITGDPFDDSTPDSGAVFVLSRTANNLWSEEAFIKAPNGGPGDDFGRKVAISGDTLAVSAPLEDSGATGVDGNQGDNSQEDSGAVYVFTRHSDGSWNYEAYIKASNAEADDNFGDSIALAGDTLVVGASGEDSVATGVDGDQLDGSAEDAGAVYVFTRDADRNWTQVAYLKASNTDPGDEFANVAIVGDSIAVGAPEEASLSGGLNADQSNNDAIPGGAGAVYVFR